MDCTVLWPLFVSLFNVQGSGWLDRYWNEVPTTTLILEDEAFTTMGEPYHGDMAFAASLSCDRIPLPENFGFRMGFCTGMLCRIR